MRKGGNMKNLILILLCLAICSGNAFAECNCKTKCNCQNNIQKTCSYKYLAEQIKKERLTISNALLLTDEQAKCRIELMRKNSAAIDEKVHQLYEANRQLKVLEATNASSNTINEQKENIKCVKKQIDEIIQEENQEFKKILDREQRAKLRMIQKLERKAVKECQNPKDYYKSNPKMRPFAVQKSPACNCSNNN